MAKTVTPSTCLNCGAPLSGEARQGFCPKCLFVQASAGMLQTNAEGGMQNAEDLQPPPVAAADSQGRDSAIGNRQSAMGNGIGDYELLEVIGRGGMGMVYRARQRSLDRVVAIKMMAFGPGCSPELVKRFRAEAVAAAALQHPSIVAIHDVGIHEGRHFFVMDYVEGQSLAQLVVSQPLPARRAAEYLKTIAQAVHYAHERGILHRDLKPSNVLIDGQDRPRVVDFGLARRLEGDSELTATGQVLGSPHYLPPEQATARRGRVSRRTDVYGLGATLYHLLTGRPPFQAESLPQTLDLVLHKEPVAPRLLNPGLPRDLETICLKCLEKEPAKRYPTAQAVAEELGQFLGGQPILSRPIGTAGKAWRWCQRNPRLATAVGVALLSLVIGLAGVSWQWRRTESQRRRAESGERLAQRNAYAADMKEVQRALEDSDLGRALELLNRYRPAGKSEVRPATTARQRGESPKSEMDLRGWEWRYLWGRCQTEERFTLHQYSTAVSALAFSPDGKWLAVRPQNSALVLWDTIARQPLAEFPASGGRWRIKALAFAPRHNLLAWSTQDASRKPTVSLKRVGDPNEISTFEHPAPVRSICISPDGNVMATMADDGVVRVWDMDSRQIATNYLTAKLDLNRARFSSTAKPIRSPSAKALPRSRGTAS